MNRAVSVPDAADGNEDAGPDGDDGDGGGPGLVGAAGSSGVVASTSVGGEASARRAPHAGQNRLSPGTGAAQAGQDRIRAV